MRLVRRRFGAEVAERSAPLLDPVAKAEALDDLSKRSSIVRMGASGWTL